jgi:hypothetical protein
MFLNTILLGFGGWIGLMGSITYIWQCEKPVTQTQITLAAVIPFFLSYALVIVSVMLRIILALAQTLLAAMVDNQLVMMFLSSILIGVSVGAGYIYAQQYFAKLTAIAEEFDDDEDEDDEEDDDEEDEDDEDDDDEEKKSEEKDEEKVEAENAPTILDNASGIDTNINSNNEEGNPVMAALTEPTPKLLRIKTPTQLLTELTPGSDATPAAPIVQTNLQALVEPPVEFPTLVSSVTSLAPMPELESEPPSFLTTPTN